MTFGMILVPVTDEQCSDFNVRFIISLQFFSAFFFLSEVIIFLHFLHYEVTWDTFCREKWFESDTSLFAVLFRIRFLQ